MTISDLLCSSHSVSLLFPSIGVHVDVESLLNVSIFIRNFPLEGEEVQTLRCAISCRTRAVDGISLNLIGVSRENERHSRHFHHHLPLHLLFSPRFAPQRGYGLFLTRHGGARRKSDFCADAHRSVARLTARTKRTRKRIEKNEILGSPQGFQQHCAPEPAADHGSNQGHQVSSLHSEPTQ